MTRPKCFIIKYLGIQDARHRAMVDDSHERMIGEADDRR
jgi:hypothetical protein